MQENGANGLGKCRWFLLDEGVSRNSTKEVGKQCALVCGVITNSDRIIAIQSGSRSVRLRVRNNKSKRDVNARVKVRRSGLADECAAASVRK
jgi:hypothetical protein